MDTPRDESGRGLVEPLTAPGPGGVAVLRVPAGPASVRLKDMLGRDLPRGHEVAYGTLRSGETQLDEVLVVGRGEGLFEVHLHGSPAIVQEVVRHLTPSGQGAVRPNPAKGSVRPMEDRARALAGACASAWGARLAMDQSRGHLRRALEAIPAMPVAERPGACRLLAARGRRGARLLTPTVVALTGPVNAGKSTLFNVLMGRDEAVVSEAPGTTRDALAGYATLDGWPVLLVDTAGERELSAQSLATDPHARIEAEGMDLARRAAARAEVVFEIEPAAASGRHPVDDVLERRGPSGATVQIRSRADESLGCDPAGWPPGALAAGPEPEHARAVIAAAWARAMGLEPCARDFARRVLGQGVPFELPLVERLAALGERSTGAEPIVARDLEMDAPEG